VPSRLGVVGLLMAAFALVPASGAAGAVACEGEDVLPGTVPHRSYARAVECVVNVQRAQAGLAALTHDRKLARAARRFSRAMVAQRFFAHESPAGSTLDERAQAAGFSGSTLGETIGWGSGHLATPAAIVSGWMNSPPHRAIILDGCFRHIGLGVASGSPAGAAGAATVTADFGA
jgi:uncharacterized protein YkwD